MPEPTGQGLPEINRQDVEKPDQLVFKLNMILRTLADQLSRVSGNVGPARVGSGERTYTGPATFQKDVTLSEGVKIGWRADRNGNKKAVNISSLSEYADDTTAKAGGLLPGDLYRTPTGSVMAVLDF